MTFAALCATLVAILFGLAVCFAGYRLFLILLPIWGFFFGFFLGAQTLQAILGGGFLGTVTGWVLGFILGLVFAVLSYLFYIVAVALISGSLGYALGTGVMMAIGFDWDLLVWLVGIVLAVIVAAVTILFNLQKWVIIAATAILGAGIMVGTLLFGVSGLDVLATLGANPVRVGLQDNPLWTIIFLVLAVLGIVAQVVNTRNWYVEAPENRMYVAPAE